MTTALRALDQASRALIEEAIAQHEPPVHEMSIADARHRMETTLPQFASRPMKHARTTHCWSGSHRVRLRVLVPHDVGRAVVVFLHGGGWVLGSAKLYESFCRELAAQARCTVVVVDYRLAPEHRFPAALDDCYAALRWTEAHLDELATPPGRIVVGGDSAGGNLAAVLAQLSLDRDGPDVALQLLVYPVVDSSLDTPSYRDPALQLLLPRETMAWYWDCYVPDPEARRHHAASPLSRRDLAGLPAALIITAGHDVLRDEGNTYVERLRGAGVAVRHEHHPDQMHGFAINPELPGHRLALAQLASEVAASAAVQP